MRTVLHDNMKVSGEISGMRDITKTRHRRKSDGSQNAGVSELAPDELRTDDDPVRESGSAVLENPLLSVVIKTLNEETKIGSCLASVREATKHYGNDVQIIVADSRSDDATVEIAGRFGVNVVRLAPSEPRGCAVGAQLGFQHSTGKHILLIDGDMRLNPAFLHDALQELETDSSLAGVAGLVDFDEANLEYRMRRERNVPHLRPGIVSQLDGGGLYRRAAIEDVGYLANRNLHSCEELDLGLRLREAGWRLKRIDTVSIYHQGHTLPALTLLKRRWSNHYIDGQGEILRAALGTRMTIHLVRQFWLSFAVIGWWAALVLYAVLALAFALPPWPLLLLALFPLITMALKHRSFVRGCYSIILWQVLAAGLIRGILRPQRNPSELIAAEVVNMAPDFPIKTHCAVS
jgi:glycosyltransferase involved in cell wall biosynthesis